MLSDALKCWTTLFQSIDWWWEDLPLRGQGELLPQEWLSWYHLSKRDWPHPQVGTSTLLQNLEFSLSLPTFLLLHNFSYPHLTVYPNLGQWHSWDDTREINIPIGKLVLDTPPFLYSIDGAIRCLHFFGLLFLSHFVYWERKIWLFQRWFKDQYTSVFHGLRRLFCTIQSHREFTSRTLKSCWNFTALVTEEAVLCFSYSSKKFSFRW